jgi:kynurenine formamidase
VQDLTHVFHEGSPVFVGPEPQREDLLTYAGDGFYSQLWSFGEHSGTHMDAPGHFVPGGRRTPDITTRELMVALAVADIAGQGGADPNAVVTRDDLRRFERRYGSIRRRSLVAVSSGWDAKIGDETACPPQHSAPEGDDRRRRGRPLGGGVGRSGAGHGGALGGQDDCSPNAVTVTLRAPPWSRCSHR